MSTPRLFLVQSFASVLAGAVSLRHTIHHHSPEEGQPVPSVFVFPLAGASLWRLAVHHQRPEASPEGVGCVDVRILGCSVEVFYRPRLGAVLA